MNRYKKLIGAVLGGITGSGVVALVAAFGGSIPEAVAVTVASALASVGAWLAPANKAA